MRPIFPSPQLRIQSLAAMRPLSLWAGVLTLAMLTGCKPIDQRSFDPDADRPPVAHVPPGPPAKIVPPFLQVQAGTPRAEWQPVVTRATRLALARRPGVLFVITVMQPEHTTLTAQTQGLDRLAATEGRAIAETIIAAGARPFQVQLAARTAPDTPAQVRVDVR